MARRRSSSAAGSWHSPPWRGPGCTIVDRGAASQPNRRPRPWRWGSPRPSSPRHTDCTVHSRSSTVAEVERRRERLEPGRVEVVRRGEEVGALREEHEADVEELLPLHPRHAAQGDVLVADHARRPRRDHRQPGAGLGQPGGEQLEVCRPHRLPGRRARASARARRRGPASRIERQRRRGEQRQRARSWTARGSEATSRSTWVDGVERLAARTGRRPGPGSASRGGTTAPPRGRWPRCAGARAGGWGCPRCGRRWP